MSRGGDPRGAVDVDPDVALGRERRLAGMEAHAHFHGSHRERALGLGRRLDRIARALEGDEETVSLRADLDPAPAGDRLADQAPVLAEHVLVALAELLEEPRRAFDVGEEKGESGGGRRAHRPTVSFTFVPTGRLAAAAVRSRVRGVWPRRASPGPGRPGSSPAGAASSPSPA